MPVHYIYIIPNLVITVPADGLAPNSAKPLADTVLNKELNMLTSNDITQNGRWGLRSISKTHESHDTESVNL